MKILHHPRAVQSGFTFLILSILLAAPELLYQPHPCQSQPKSLRWMAWC